MSSRRLPGKVLREVNGRPALVYLLERLERAGELDAIVLATSTEPDDDPLERFCSGRGVDCVRGPLEDVATRFDDAAEQHSLDALVRVSGDSPLLDQSLVDMGVALFREGGADLVSNVFPRTFPNGESVEVLSAEALRRALPEMEGAEREHVTTAFYSHPDRYAIAGFDLDGEDLSGVSLAVDTAADAETVAAILARMTRPHWEYGVRDLLELRAAVVGSAA